MTDKKLEEAALEFATKEGYDAPLVAKECFIAGAKWREENPGWISIKEKLPPNQHINCLCYLINARESVGSWNGEVFSLYHDEAGLEGDITHWMPLPKAPEGE